MVPPSLPIEETLQSKEISLPFFSFFFFLFFYSYSHYTSGMMGQGHSVLDIFDDSSHAPECIQPGCRGDALDGCQQTEDAKTLSAIQNNQISLLRVFTFMSPEQMDQMFTALIHNTSITDIVWNTSNVGDKHNVEEAPYLRRLLSAMKQNKGTNLTSIRIGVQSLPVDVISQLADTIQSVPSVHRVSLFRCGIDNVGCDILATLVATSTTLQDLRLTYNNIGDKGALAMERALQTNTSLTTLSLSLNPFSDNSARCLIETLRYNHTLLVFDVKGGVMSRQRRRALAWNRRYAEWRQSEQVYLCFKDSLQDYLEEDHMIRLVVGFTSTPGGTPPVWHKPPYRDKLNALASPESP